jgi:hypothetical protein
MSKVKKVPTEKNVKDSYLMPDGSMIDLDSYDWGKDKLTDKQKLFVVWFCMPQTEYYHQAMKAARKAGYTPKTAKAEAFKQRRDPRIEKLIKQFEDSIGKRNLLDAAERFLQEKIIRSDFDVRDFYEILEEPIGETGRIRRILKLKNMDELTREQLLCVDGIDVKGQLGIPVFILPDRQKERDGIIAFAKKETSTNIEDGYNADETKEIIIERITVREAKRARQSKEADSDIVDSPKDIEEEL